MLGEHTTHVMRALGYTEQEMERYMDPKKAQPREGKHLGSWKGNASVILTLTLTLTLIGKAWSRL